MKAGVQHFSRWLEELGGLHDSRMTFFRYDVENSDIEIGIDDLYWNFEGMPEYPGATPATLRFSNVSDVAIEWRDVEDGFWIVDSSCTSGLQPRVTFTRNCGDKLAFSFEQAEFPESKLPRS
jgi:hypothetical protein